MPLTKQKKIIVGSTVGAIVIAAAISCTVYLVIKKKSEAASAADASASWTCADNGQNAYILFKNTVPCGKYDLSDSCNSASKNNGVDCSTCTSKNEVLYTDGTCVPICNDTATLDTTSNTCECPSGSTYNVLSHKKCDKDTYICKYDTQFGYNLLKNDIPCVQYTTLDLCTAALTQAENTPLKCVCVAGKVLNQTNNTAGTCTTYCDPSANWDAVKNECNCSTGYIPNNSKPGCVKETCAQLTINQTTGLVSGQIQTQAGTCVDVNTIQSSGTDYEAMVKNCGLVVCKNSFCTKAGGNLNFHGYDSTSQTCMIPQNVCSGLQYPYTWPNGANFCTGLTYGFDSKNGSCTILDNTTLQPACEYTADGCPVNHQLLQTGEVCNNTGTCRQAGDIPTCGTNSSVDPNNCPTGSLGPCYNTGTNKCSVGTYSNCVVPSLPCPENYTLDKTKCNNVSNGYCYSSTNAVSCLPQLTGCRPDSENWKFDTALNICNDVTSYTGSLTLTSPSNTTSNTNNVYVNVTFNTSVADMLSLIYYYNILDESTSNHWTGYVSDVQLVNSPANTVQLTIYPDQSVNPVPASTNLKLLIIVKTLQSDGTYISKYTSYYFNNASVFTFQVSSAPTSSCEVPSVSFLPLKASQVATKLSTMTTLALAQIGVVSDALTAGLINAGVPSVPSSGSTFLGSIVPLKNIPSSPSQQADSVFIVLAWNALPADKATSITYNLTRDGAASVYSGPLTTVVDYLPITNTDTTYSLTVNAIPSTCATLPCTACSSPSRTTTCPKIAYTVQMCTSITDGTNTLHNFSIPDGTGKCKTVDTADWTGAEYYNCMYLQNPNRNSDPKKMKIDPTLKIPYNNQCLPINQITTPMMTQSLSENIVAGAPTGYCKDAKTPVSTPSRNAVCACDPTNTQTTCNGSNQSELPLFTLNNGSSSPPTIKFATIDAGIGSMKTFIDSYSGLLFT